MSANGAHVFGGVTVSTGYRWASVETHGLSAATVLRSNLKALGAGVNVNLTKGEYVAIGFVDKVDAKLNAKSLKHPSAMAMLTLAAPTQAYWVVKEAVGDGQFWVGVLIDGVPDAESDQILSEQAADEFVERFLADDERYELHFNEFAALTARLSKKSKAACIPSGADSQRIRLLASLVLLSILVAGGTIGFEEWKKIERQRKLSQNDQADQAAQNAEAERQAQLAREKRLDELAAKLRTGDAQTQMTDWIKAIGPIEVRIKGWSLRTLSCNPNQCTLTYQRETGFVKNLLAAWPKAVVSLDKPNEAVVVLPVDSSTRPMTRQDLTQAWSTEMRVNLLQLRHMADAAKVTFQAQEPQTDSLVGAHVGSWKSTGKEISDLWKLHLPQLMDTMKLVPGLSMSNLQMNFQGGQFGQWELAGDFVFLKASQ